LQASAIKRPDLEMQPPAVARLEASRGVAGGVLIRTTPGVGDRVDIALLDATGRTSPAPNNVDWSASKPFGVPARIPRRDRRHDLLAPAGEATVRQVLGSIDNSGLPSGPDARIEVVVDAGNGAAGLLLPALVGGLASTC